MLQKVFSKLSKRSFLKYKILLPIGVGILVLLLVFRLFTIKNIVCFENNIPCDENIVSVLVEKKSNSIFTFNKIKVLKELNKIKPVTSFEFHFKFPNKLTVNIKTDTGAIPVYLGLVSEFPTLSINLPPASTESAVTFVKPSIDIQKKLDEVMLSSFEIWFNGELKPIATTEAKVTLLIKEKFSAEELKSIYTLLELVKKHLNVNKVFILGRTVFLSAEGQPDIITSVPYDEAVLLEALQSLGFFTTMKQNPTIIDLRYKNPIIR